MSLLDQGIFVRMVPLPPHINGITVPNPDNTFEVYINSNLSELRQKAALNHELNHIKKDHFYLPQDVAVIELAAGM